MTITHQSQAYYVRNEAELLALLFYVFKIRKAS
jgi:hypothetical protein